MKLLPYIRRAAEELTQKTLNDIQVETALVWAGRAYAAAQMRKLADAVEYAHEAIEHAALSGDDGLLLAIRQALNECGVPGY